MTIENAISLLAVSVPLAALIHRAKRNGEDDSVSEREFDHFRADMGDQLVEIKTALRGLEEYVKSRL